jgi:ankyrin repeat protein
MADEDPGHEQLYWAIRNGDDELALSIVSGGVDVNGEYNGHTHLYWASRYNQVAFVFCLLELGADVDKTTNDGWTPLLAATSYGHQEVVESLVEVGNARLNKQDGAGLTALYAAAVRDRTMIAKYLVAHGCSLTEQDQLGRTALGAATQYNHNQLAEFLAIASNLTTANDYISLRTLCTPYSSPYLSLNIARQLRYTTILAARHARRIHDDPSLHTPLNPFLLRLALLPSADSRTYQTEGQVFRRVLTFVGTGFDVDVISSVSSRTR